MIGRGNAKKKLSSQIDSGARGVGAIRRAVVETLEARQLLTAVVTGGILTIDDSLQTTSVHILVDVDSQTNEYRVTDTGTVQEFPKAGIDSTQILGGSAADFIEVDATFPNASQDNGIAGGNGADTVLGSPGPDVIQGGGGPDSLEGRGGDDNVSGGGNNDTVTGGPGNDTMFGDNGNDEVHGGIGADMVIGGAGADTLFGGAGNDTVNGKAGPDEEFGGGGDDAMNGGKGPDSLFGGNGNDTLSGGKGRDILAGDNEDLLPIGGATVAAGAGVDSLAGGLGADTLLALGGADTISGAAGPDDFNVLSTDTLIDFDAGTGDFQPSQQVFSGSATTDITITLDINAFGAAVPIPSNAGSFTGGTSVAEVTSVSGDTATVQFRDVNPRTFVLGDFFNQWGVTLTANGIGRQVDGPQGQLTMMVNGQANVSFNSYVVQNGDHVVLTYA